MRAKTRCVGEQYRSHHQVAAVDVEGRAGDVAGGLGGGEANQIGDFERGAEAQDGIARGETFEQSSEACSRVSSVSIMPGQMAFTVMPNLPSSFAAARVSPSSPAFDAV